MLTAANGDRGERGGGVDVDVGTVVTLSCDGRLSKMNLPRRLWLAGGAEISAGEDEGDGKDAELEYADASGWEDGGMFS